MIHLGTVIFLRPSDPASLELLVSAPASQDDLALSFGNLCLIFHPIAYIM